MGCPRPVCPRSDPYDLGQLEKPLRDRVYTMMLASPTRGLTLVSGYRDPARQWDLRHDRVPHGQECNPKVRAVPATAVPYASNHQKRKAADLGGRDLPWAVTNHGRFGLVRAVPSEAWHYEVGGRPSVPIVAYPGPTYDGQPAPTPNPAHPEELTMDAEARQAFATLQTAIQQGFATLTKDLVDQINRDIGAGQTSQKAVEASITAAVNGAIAFLVKVQTDIEARQKAAATAYEAELRKLAAGR